MNVHLRVSPLHDEWHALAPEWTVINGMQVPKRVARSDETKLQGVALTDLSCLKRTGLKGPNAAQWLRGQGISPPEGINQWSMLGERGLIARLATSEFFIEDGIGPTGYAEQVKAALGGGLPGVTPVMRQDAEMVLAGDRVNELLLQTCNVNFAKLELAQRPVIMTSVIGVSMLIIPGTWRNRPFYQLWFDCTYASYVWHHLLEIAEELGGGAVGWDTLFPDFEKR